MEAPKRITRMGGGVSEPAIEDSASIDTNQPSAIPKREDRQKQLSRAAGICMARFDYSSIYRARNKAAVHGRSFRFQQSPNSILSSQSLNWLLTPPHRCQYHNCTHPGDVGR